MPETVDEAKALRIWADAQDDRPRPASILQITKHLAFMAATLPSKKLGEDDGKMRVAVYSKILGDFSNEALAYMARRACAELDWFPTPRWCLETAKEYRRPPTEKDDALALCHSFWQGKYEDFVLALETDTADQGMIDAVPRQWRMIAMERGFLRYFPEDDRFVLRRKSIVAPDYEVRA